MRAPRAFTLIELLVVVGIIGLLVGLLLPALRSAREAAVSVQCQANLRSCGQVLYTYATQNKGIFPPMAPLDPEFILEGNPTSVLQNMHIPVPPAPDAVIYPYLRTALDRLVNGDRNPTAPYTPGGIKIFYCPANYLWDSDPRYSVITQASHWPEDFLDSGRIKYNYFGCPNPWYPRFHYKGKFGIRGDGPSGAMFNCLDWVCWDLNHNGDNRDDYLNKISDKNTSKLALMTDQSRVAYSVQSRVFGFTFIHGKKNGSRITGWINVLFGDGHVESRRARESSFSAAGDEYGNGEPSPDEVQLRWGLSDHPYLW